MKGSFQELVASKNVVYFWKDGKCFGFLFFYFFSCCANEIEGNKNKITRCRQKKNKLEQ